MRPSLWAIRLLPKADLHSHIDGSVEAKALFRIAQNHRRKIITTKGAELESVSAFMRYIEGGGYNSMLDNIVDRFYPITSLMQTEGIIRDVAISYVRAQKQEGVAYAEGRFAPQYHTREGLSLKDAIVSMADGLAEGTERYGVKTALIVGIGRETNPGLGVEVAGAAANSGLVAALDLCGTEAGNPPLRFKEAFRVAVASGLKVTVHAGEGAESMTQNLRNMEDSISQLHANRLGHAIPLARSETLLKLVLRRSVTIEMNPISNLVLHKIRGLRALAIDQLLARGVRVSVNSDDPAIWPRGRLSDVYSRVCAAYGFDYDVLDTLIENSFVGSFAAERDREWLRQLYGEARRRTGFKG
jgi:adenosine deaminase